MRCRLPRDLENYDRAGCRTSARAARSRCTRAACRRVTSGFTRSETVATTPRAARQPLDHPRAPPSLSTLMQQHSGVERLASSRSVFPTPLKTMSSADEAGAQRAVRAHRQTRRRRPRRASRAARASRALEFALSCSECGAAPARAIASASCVVPLADRRRAVHVRRRADRRARSARAARRRTRASPSCLRVSLRRSVRLRPQRLGDGRLAALETASSAPRRSELLVGQDANRRLRLLLDRVPRTRRSPHQPA